MNKAIWGGAAVVVGVAATVALVNAGGSTRPSAAETPVETPSPMAVQQPKTVTHLPMDEAPAATGTDVRSPERPQGPRGERGQRGQRGGWGDSEQAEEWRKRWEAMSEEERAQFRERMERGRRQMEQGMLERFDKDGDGQLSDEERVAMREQMRAERAAEMRGRFESMFGGPVELSDGEMAMVGRMYFEQNREQMQEFRRIGEEMRREAMADGEFSQAEMQAMRAAMEAAMTEMQARMQQQLVGNYDADGDGSLNDTERLRAAQELREQANTWGIQRQVDTNRDGVIDENESLGYMSRFDNQERGADLNRDGVIDESDFTSFLNIIGR